MKYVVSFVAAIMLMGIMGCNSLSVSSPTPPPENCQYAWEIKVSRDTIDKKPVFFFNWTLFKVTGDEMEYMDSSNMVASYNQPGEFKKKSDEKELKTIFSVKKSDNGLDIATGELSIRKPYKGKYREECWKLRRLIPANLKKPIVFRIPEEPKKKDDIQDKTK